VGSASEPAWVGSVVIHGIVSGTALVMLVGLQTDHREAECAYPPGVLPRVRAGGLQSEALDAA